MSGALRPPDGVSVGVRSTADPAMPIHAKTAMPPITHKARLQKTHKELALLALAALMCVLTLTIGVARANPSAIGELAFSNLLLLILIGGGLVTAVAIVWATTAGLRHQLSKANTDNSNLRRNLATAEAIINAEPQILIFWDKGQELRVVSHTLRGISGVPQDRAALLRFASWLTARSAASLKDALDALFNEGLSFNIILKTSIGGHLEADGRAAAGRAVLRLRDVAGYKKDISTIIDGHQNLARDIRSARALMNMLPMPVWLRDAGGRICWVNAAYAKAVEADSDSEVIDGQIELLEQRQRKSISRSLVMGRCYRERLPVIVGGERKVHEIVVLRQEYATAGVAIDISMIEGTNADRDGHTSAYDRTLDRVTTAVVIFDAERRLSFFNDAFKELWQLDATWLHGGPSDGAVLDRLRELGRLPEVVNYGEWRANVLHALDNAEEYEDRWPLPDGRFVHMMAVLRPDGGTTYLFVDETERLNMRTQVKAMSRVQGETLDSLKEGVAVFGTDGRLKLHNRAFRVIWHLEDDQIDESSHVDEVISVIRHHYDNDMAWRDIKLAVTALRDQRTPIDGQMMRSDQSVIDYASMPLPDGGTLITFADVTDSKRYERALIDRNEALEAAAGLKNKFISHVSYEMRTPLTNIIGFSELLSSSHVGPLNEKQQEYLFDITSSSTTLLTIIDGILDLATIDAGALELEVAIVDVRELVGSVVRTVEERAVRSQLIVDVAIEDDITSIPVDEARMRQVLYNLLSNAISFSKAGGTVMVSCWRQDGQVAIQIEDQGIGIPLEHQEKVFERFESRSQGVRHRGAGLGLSIVKSLVELHGGHMHLESEPDKGTRVTVFVPEDGLPSIDEEDGHDDDGAYQGEHRSDHPAEQLKKTAELMRGLDEAKPEAEADVAANDETVAKPSSGPQVIASGLPPRR